MKKTAKKLSALLLSLVMIISTLPMTGITAFAAEGDVAINGTNFPDANFRAYVKENYDKDGNGVLRSEEIENVTEVYVDEAGITSLKGIEYFTALTSLSCDNNQLTSLDLSKNVELWYLSCGNNQLTSLDVSGATALKTLYCYDNQLTSLDVSKNTALTELYCSDNQLTSLDVSKNTMLESLSCYNNQLTSLDVSKNTALRRLYCYNNQLASLDVSGATALTELQCYDNQLTSLDVSNNTGLYKLFCYDNQFVIEIDENNNFDLSTLPGNFDVSKASNWNGESINGNILTVNKAANKVTYTYDMGNGKSETFTLLILIAEINETNFPDATFRTYVQEKCDTDGNGVLSSNEIENVTEMYVGAKQIASLKGIEYFTALTELYCSSNPLTSLDVSKNTALTYLNCGDNQLTSIDVSKNTALKTLNCYNNQLTSLDVSKNTALVYLYCSTNQLTSLDVSKNTVLRTLDCYNNQLTSLDVSKNTALDSLYCYGNQLTSLDVSKNTAITYLDCSDNQLTSLDVSKNTALTYLGCYNNQFVIEIDENNNFDLSTLPGNFDVSKASNWNGGSVNGNILTVNKAANKVTYAYDMGNGETETFTLIRIIKPIAEINETNFPDANFRDYVKLNCDTDSNGVLSDYEIEKATEIDLSDYYYHITSLKGIEYFTELEKLNCSDNQLTSLDVSKNTALTYLNCGDNQLTSIDVSKNTALKTLNCYNNQLTSLDVSSNTVLTELGCSYNQLTSLDISNNTALMGLNCENNQLTSLDVSNNTALTSLSCGGNQLTSLDVSKNPALDTLSCGENQLTSLDVSNNTALTVLYCNENQFTSLDVGNNTALTALNCEGNYLTRLDVSKNTALTELGCSYNQLASLDVSKNTELTELRCNYNQLTSLDVSKNIELTGLSCYSNQLTNLDLSNNTMLYDLDCSDNQFSIEIDENNNFDLTTLPGTFYVSKTRDWKGGSVNGKTLTVNGGIDKVTYTYNMGNGKTETFAIMVNNPSAATASSIEVSTMPSKTVYIVGETFSSDGFSIKVIMSDGTSKTVTSGFTVSPPDMTTSGTKTVTVTYQDKISTFTITVNNPPVATVSSIAVQSKPTKTVYTVGETFNSNGLSIKVNMNDGISRTVTSGFTVSSPDMKTAGTKTVTVTYSGKTTTFSITVNKASVATVSSIAVQSMPTKTVYTVSEAFNSNGLSIKVNMSDGTSKTVTSGFTVSSPDMKTAGTKTITVNYSGKTTTFTITVNNPSAVTVSSIAVQSMPSKTVYTVGETFNSSGLSIKVNMSDGTSKTVTSGFSVSLPDMTTAGKKTITVSFDGKTATFNITVNKASVATVSSIAVSTMPSKTTYTVGETFKSNGLAIKVNMSDGTSKTVTSGFSVSLPDMKTAGTKTVTVTYQGKTATFNITVNKASVATVSSIAVSTMPSKTTYTVGEAFNSNGLSIKVNMSDGTSKTVKDGFKVSSPNMTTAGKKAVTVTYQGKTATFNITVNKASVAAVSSIAVSTMPSKTTYTVGEAFSSNGLSIKVNMSDGTSKTVKDGFKVSSPDMKTAGKKTVTVTYQGKTATFNITVNNPTSKVTFGDVNGDGKITIVDAKWILQSVANLRNLSDVQKTAADLNNDGKVTIVDAKWVLQIVANLRDGATLKMK